MTKELKTNRVGSSKEKISVDDDIQNLKVQLQKWKKENMHLEKENKILKKERIFEKTNATKRK